MATEKNLYAKMAEAWVKIVNPKKGDKFKVTRVIENYSEGWNDVWPTGVRVGEIVTFDGMSPVSGSVQTAKGWLPYFVLEPSAKVDTINVKGRISIDRTFDVEFLDNGRMKVGCTTFTKTATTKLLKLMGEVLEIQGINGQPAALVVSDFVFDRETIAAVTKGYEEYNK